MIKPVGNGEAVLKYLAPYVYRVALSDNRMVAIDDQRVTYKVKRSGTQHWVTRSVPGEQFVQNFVQHILPHGFKKIRCYGWMSSNSKQRENVRWLVWLWRGWTYWLGSGMVQPEPRQKPVLTCAHCGGQLRLKSIVDPNFQTIWRQSAKQLSERGPP